jgi:hypothetical protein
MTDDRIEQIRAALWENLHAPNGPVRNARAEELVARAEDTGDSGLLLESLSQLITAYEYSAERSKLFVPFARMLRMWDEDPGRFDDRMSYELFWRFKWVTGSMIDYPDIPLASVEQWLGEMERRYRLAGYNARTVRAEEFEVAWHVGDLARAEAAHAVWLAGERDRMSNCHACEANELGSWEVHQGRDELALERWAPVLEGKLTCAEEPHRVLAYSLLPLLRTGQLDRARTNHLRGYRMARGNESLLHAVGHHIEFCVLTGNEARGLEILAEHARYLDGTGNPLAVRSLMEAAVLLLDRLALLGLGDRPTPGPAGAEWTVATLRAHCDQHRTGLTARFDLRNGSDFISRNSAARIAQQPLLERLPLGVNAVLPGAVPVSRPAGVAGAPGAAGAAGAQPVVPESAPFEEQLAEARRLRDLGHPTTGRAWLAVEAALPGTGSGDVPEALDPLLGAELATQRGIRVAGKDVETALACFEEAAAAYRAVGRDGDAAVGDGRAALATAIAGRHGQARERVEAAVSTARAALDSDRATARQLATVLLCRARVLTVLARDGQGEAVRDEARSASQQEQEQEQEQAQAQALAEAEQALTEAVGAIEAIAPTGPVDGDGGSGRDGGDGGDGTGGADPSEVRRRNSLLADAHRNRAGLAEPELARMLPALRASADAYLLAEEPWGAAEVLLPLARVHAQLGDLAEAEAAAEGVLLHGGAFLDADAAGHAHLLLADLLGHRNAHEEAVRHALEATRWLDETGRGSAEAAAARHRLAVSYQALGRHAEAAEVIQSALPDLVAHGERAEVTARRVLGESLSELREHAEAAEQFALAARIVDGWGQPYPSAQLASSTAEALSAAGRGEQAEAVYQRAQSLWAEAGVTGMVVRTLRARAWLTFRQGRDADPGRALMLEAEQAAAAALSALAAPELDGEEADGLRREHADTWRQLAGLLRDVAEDEGWNDVAIPAESQAALYQEAWDAYRTAARAFARCASPGPALSAQALLDAVRVRIDLGQHETAAVEAKQVQALAAEAAEGAAAPDAEALAGIGQRAGSLLEWLEWQTGAGDSERQ